MKVVKVHSSTELVFCALNDTSHLPDCLKLTRALQKTSETLQSVADLYDDHVRRSPSAHLELF